MGAAGVLGQVIFELDVGAFELRLDLQAELAACDAEVVGTFRGDLGFLECGLLLFPVLGNRPELRQLLRRVGRRADGYEQHRQLDPIAKP